MSSQSAPIQEVSRLLDLVPFLSTHSHISLKELAGEFGVSEKAMANELTALSMCGLPGYTPYELIEIFFDSGFVTINNHDTLDIPRALTQLEVASLLIGLEILRDSAIHEEGNLVEKIDSLVVQMKTLLGGTLEMDENPTTALQTIITGAIEARKSLSLQYRSPIKDEITSREVDPFELRFERDHLYLVAFCRTAQAVRHFRLDRIEEITEGEDSQLSGSSLTAPEPESLTVTLKVSGDRRSVAEALSIPNMSSDEVVVEIFSPEWIAKAVIAHAPHMELVAPATARESVRKTAENILALYSS